ncbi:MAG: site-specific integrase [Paludibacter sp.]|nr:site-specific integrase [Paludibacter sp.]
MKPAIKITASRKGTKKNNVILREKPLNNGNKSLYLDIYRDGTRTYEFLKLYVNAKARTPIDREANREVLELAEKIRTQKESDLNHEAHGQISPSTKKINFLDYYQAYIDKYTKADIRMIKASFERFKDFLKEYYPALQYNIKPDQLTKDMMMLFVEYLESKSTGEGALTFYKRFKKVIKYAVEHNVISKNPCAGVVCKVDEHALTKDILSVDEMKKLIATRYPEQNLNTRRAFIFTLYTGIRFCDIIELKYSDVDFSNKTLKFNQAKTKGHSANSWVNIPLNDGLLSLIGDKPAKPDFIFHLPSQTMCLKALRHWVTKAGIDKHITWHCGRHSFAVNILNNGANIKTVASLLGHSGLKHTEKYTRAVDSLKEKAINSLPTFEN